MCGNIFNIYFGVLTKLVIFRRKIHKIIPNFDGSLDRV